MTPKDLQAFLSRGLGWIVRHIPEWTREARMRLSTNDAVIVCFAEPDGGTVRAYFRKRTEAAALLGLHLPNYAATIALVEEPRTPAEIPVIIMHKGEIFTIIYPLTDKDSAVLN